MSFLDPLEPVATLQMYPGPIVFTRQGKKLGCDDVYYCIKYFLLLRSPKMLIQGHDQIPSWHRTKI